MPDIKSLGSISDKWRRKASTSAQDYAEGVQNSQSDWAAKTSAANASWKAGVTAAVQRDAFTRGVQRTGTNGWKSATVAKGPARWSQGIDLSGDAYVRGFTPYHQVIQNTKLPERGPRGAEQNYTRAAAMGKALHAAKLAGA